MKALILVNLDANSKNAKKKWGHIEKEVLRSIHGPTEVIKFNIPYDLKACLHDKIAIKGIRCIISAGGDGTANKVINTLSKDSEIDMSELTMGFIGLGSSNDLLKPISKKIKSIPVKLNMSKVMPIDLGAATFIDENHKIKKQLFMGNSSIGVGASGNWLFNEEDFIINRLKSRFINLAILYTTIKSIFKFKNYPLILKYNGFKKELMISYLAILKTPHISGKMKFDQNILSNDGQLGLNFCERMNRKELMLVLIDLQRGVFSGKKKRHSIFIKELYIKSKSFIPIEFDGEVKLTKEVSYSVLPDAINCMQ